MPFVDRPGERSTSAATVCSVISVVTGCVCE
jgi:hypothetical protein